MIVREEGSRKGDDGRVWLAEHVASTLRSALTPYASEIRFAILFGYVARDADYADSEIDVMIVTDSVAIDFVYLALMPAEVFLERPISPIVYTGDEFLARIKRRNPFLTRVLEGTYSVLLAADEGLQARVPRQRPAPHPNQR
jgi:hypothetical protein